MATAEPGRGATGTRPDGEVGGGVPDDANARGPTVTSPSGPPWPSGPSGRGPLWLIGMMGTGKSRVGRVLAARLGWGFLDTDELIEAQSGRTITELFAVEGEPAFRERERALATRMAAAGFEGVIATGGGMPCIDGVLDEMKRSGLVVWLRAQPDEVLGRMDIAKRPLLRSSGAATASARDSAASVSEALAEAVAEPRSAAAATATKPEEHAALDRWRAIAADRINCYARADLFIDRRHREAEAIADELAAWIADYGPWSAGAPCREALVVPLGERSYPVLLDGEPGAAARFAATLARRAPPGRARLGVVTDETVARLHLPRYRAA